MFGIARTGRRLKRLMRRQNPDRVPGAENAVADDRKFTEYLCNTEHPDGQHKARVFASIGYTADNWEDFRAMIVGELPYVVGHFNRLNFANPPGESWDARMTIEGPRGTADLVTVWAVNPDEPTRLVTVYPS